MTLRQLSILLFFLPYFVVLGNTTGSASVYFIENKGQIVDQYNMVNTNVLYVYSGKNINLQLRKDGYSYEFFSMNNPVKKITTSKVFDQESLKNVAIQTSRVDVDFNKMGPNAKVKASGQQNSLLNYYSNGLQISNVKSYEKIIYENVYPNTDIEFVITGNNNNPVKYNIILKPGADINNVQFLCKGAESVINTGDKITFNAQNGVVSEEIPFSYYTDEPLVNQPVNFVYEKGVISFKCEHNKEKTMIIDPSSNIIWGTFFGGAQIDYCSATAVDAQNNVYITGHTLSNSNIATVGAYQNTLSGSFDIYLAKFTSSGNLVWGTYFGSNNYETAYALTIENAGNIYVSGNTSSTVNIASPGAHQTVYGGGIDDGLLIKFDSNGQRIWSTYYGGNEHDIAICLTLDGAGNVFISGHTESVNGLNAIATPGAFSTVFAFGFDAFIAKFNSAGVRQWGTYFGDSGLEEAWGIAVDINADVFITGFTSSISGIATFASHQQFAGGGTDAFIAKFDATGSNLLWATYYGGAGDDIGAVIEAKNPGDVIYIGGNTGSNSNISTLGSYQPNIGSAEDVFLTAFTTTGDRIWGTYFGGEQPEYIYDMLIDGNDFLICGQTLSTNSISTPGSYQVNVGLANTYEAYFTKFKGDGNLILSSYYGSTGNDHGRGIALDNNGLLYLAGESTSTVGLTTPGAYQVSPLGAGDGFLAKFCMTPKPEILPVSIPTLCVNDYHTFTCTPSFATYSWSNGANGNTLTVGGAWFPGTYTYVVAVVDVYGCSGESDTAKVQVNNCLTSIHEIQSEEISSIYPNPTENFIYLNGSSFLPEQEIEIITATGQKLQSFYLDENKKIGVRHLSPGIYFLQWKTDGVTRVKKMIKN